MGDNWGCNDDGVLVRERLGSVDMKIKLGWGLFFIGVLYINVFFIESFYI